MLAQQIEVIDRVAQMIGIGIKLGARIGEIWKLRSVCGPSERGCMRNSITLSRTGAE
jgi:hypothetical protein